MTNRLAKLVAVTGIIGFLITPVWAQISVRSGLSDDRTVTPGTTYEGIIKVRNETGEIQQAKIYQTDYRFFSDGSNLYGSPGQDERSNADWTLLSNSLLTIPPLETVDVSYVVSVPISTPESPLEGSYWSMVMVETLPSESPESTLGNDEKKPGFGILQIMRYGVQIATHIENTGQTELALDGTGLVQQGDGATALNLNIENEGSIMLRPEVWVELYDTDGTARGTFSGIKNRIYPGTSVNQQISFGAITPGNYKALVVLDTGGDSIFGAEYDLEIKSSMADIGK